MPYRAETLCPRCSRLYAITGDASANLADLFAGILPGWVEHWSAAGADKRYLAEVLKELRVMNGVADPNGSWDRFDAEISRGLEVLGEA